MTVLRHRVSLFALLAALGLAQAATAQAAAAQKSDAPEAAAPAAVPAPALNEPVRLERPTGADRPSGSDRPTGADRPTGVRASHRVDVIGPGERVETIFDRLRGGRGNKPANDSKATLPVRGPDKGRGGPDRPDHGEPQHGPDGSHGPPGGGAPPGGGPPSDRPPR